MLTFSSKLSLGRELMLFDFRDNAKIFPKEGLSGATIAIGASKRSCYCGLAVSFSRRFFQWSDLSPLGVVFSSMEVYSFGYVSNFHVLTKHMRVT